MFLSMLSDELAVVAVTPTWTQTDTHTDTQTLYFLARYKLSTSNNSHCRPTLNLYRKSFHTTQLVSILNTVCGWFTQ